MKKAHSLRGGLLCACSAQCRSRASGYSLQPTAYSLALAALCAVSATASAANWEFAPRIEGGYRYNDNYRLDQPGQEIDVSGAEVDALLTMRTLDPRTNFEITPRVNATYFPDHQDEDSTDYSLSASVSDVTPRHQTGVSGEFSREDVVRSEFPDPDIEGDLGNPQEVDSGRFVQRNKRDLIRVAPYFHYDVTERQRVEFEARYIDAQFERQLPDFQQNFTEYGLNAAYGFRTSPRSTILVRGLAARYETATESDGYGAVFEWQTDFSPTSRMYVSLGAQDTKPERSDSQTTVIGGIGGRWTSPRNRLFIDLTRAVSAVSSGTVVERHQLRLRVDHDVSPRVALLFAARATRDDDINDVGARPQREYATAEAGIVWRWLRQLALTATYSYRWQDYSNEPSDVSANGFLVGFVYEPKRRD